MGCKPGRNHPQVTLRYAEFAGIKRRIAPFGTVLPHQRQKTVKDVFPAERFGRSRLLRHTPAHRHQESLQEVAPGYLSVYSAPTHLPGHIHPQNGRGPRLGTRRVEKKGSSRRKRIQPASSGIAASWKSPSGKVNIRTAKSSPASSRCSIAPGKSNSSAPACRR